MGGSSRYGERSVGVVEGLPAATLPDYDPPGGVGHAAAAAAVEYIC